MKLNITSKLKSKLNNNVINGQKVSSTAQNRVTERESEREEREKTRKNGLEHVKRTKPDTPGVKETREGTRLE